MKVEARIFTKRLEELATAKGMSHRDVAESIGMTDAAVSRYFNGDRIPKGTVIVRMAELFGCTTDYLLGMTDENRTGKCIYCDTNNPDWAYETIPIDMGDFGKYELIFYVSEGRKWFGADFGEVKHEPLISTHVNIKFCPFCGRKL